MVVPNLEEAERLYAERKISKQNICQIRKIHAGICRSCHRAATRGRLCRVCSSAASERREAGGAKKATCLRCGRKGHYQKTCNAGVGP